MSFPVEAFWKLLVDSQLVSLDDARQYHAAWAQQYPQGDAQQLAEWLVAGNLISRYQASILLAGRAGPFVYGDYRIYDRIEKGRLAGIFRAVHVPTMHRVCLQFLTGEQSASPEVVQYLAQQAALVSRTSAGYPHLLRCYHLVDLGPFKFFVLEDLQGKRIERILAQKGALPTYEACRVARQAALGLARLHAMQQAHGDVRPANVWVDATGVVKLVQFPLARNPLAPPIEWRKLLSAGAAQEVPDEADYVAPERIPGDRPADVRSDLYQLGCTLYQMLTAKPPFPGKTLREKLEGHVKGQPVGIEKISPSVPSDLVKLVGYLLQKKPDMRYQQAASVVEKLTPFVSAADAQWQPTPPTRIEQAYEAYVQQYLLAGVPAGSPPQGGMGAAPVPMAAAPAPAMAAAPAAAPGGRSAAMGSAAMGSAAMGPSAHGPAPTPMGPRIQGSEMSFAERAQRRRAKSLRTTFALLFVAALLGGGGYFFVPWDKLIAKNDGGTPAPAASAPSPAPTATGPVPTATATSTVPAGNLIAARDNLASSGDGVYESPTFGKPLDLAYFIPAAEMLVALRPAEIMARPEIGNLIDERVIGPLGPWFMTTLPKLAGTGNENIEQVLVGIVDGPDAASVEQGYVIRTREVIPEETLLKAWGDPAPADVEGAKTFAKDGRAYHLPPAGQGKIIVIAPEKRMAELLKYKGESPGLAKREPNVLLQSTDADRHFSILFAPYFFKSGGRSLIEGTPAGPGVNGLNWLLTGYGLAPAAGEVMDGATAMPVNPEDAEPPKAVLVSAHFGEGGLFWELRAYNNNANAQDDSPAGPLLSRAKEIPQRTKGFVGALPLHPYSRQVVMELPTMAKFLSNHIRGASGDRQLVLRGYMPEIALHNVALATYRGLLEATGSTAGGAAEAPPDKPSQPKPKNATEALAYRMALGFERNSLDFTVIMIAEQIGIPIEIIGPDLLLEGITKNQSFKLDEPEQTVDELLRKILMLSNADGKLVYQIKPRPGETEDIIIITTRAAVEKRKEKLLPIFATPKK